MRNEDYPKILAARRAKEHARQQMDRELRASREAAAAPLDPEAQAATARLLAHLRAGPR